MYEHVKTGCKHIPPLQFQSGYYLNKPRITDTSTGMFRMKFVRSPCPLLLNPTVFSRLFSFSWRLDGREQWFVAFLALGSVKGKILSEDLYNVRLIFNRSVPGGNCMYHRL